MKLTLENTDQLVSLEVNGVYVPARIWEGTTESGVAVICFITRLAVRNDQDTTQFDRELREVRAPSAETLRFAMGLVL